MRAGEARARGVLVEGAGPHGDQAQPATLVERGVAPPIAPHDCLDESATARSRRAPAARPGARAQLDRLAAVDRRVDRVGQRSRSRPEQSDLAGRTVDPHAGTVGDHRRRVAGADDPGDAVLARHDRRVAQLPPRSVTIAPSSGSTTLKYGEVLRVTSTSPCLIRPKSAEAGPAAPCPRTPRR